jgi:hypothetical protein
VKRLLVTLILLALLLTACGGLIRAGQTPIPGPTGSPTGTGVPGPPFAGGGEEGSDGGPGEGQRDGLGEGDSEVPVTEGPPLTG